MLNKNIIFKLALSLLILFISPTAFAQIIEENNNEVPKSSVSQDKIIINWEDDVNKNQRTEIKNNNDLEVIDNLGNKDFQLLEITDNSNINSVINKLEENNEIKSVSKEGYSVLHATNDVDYNKLWALENQNLNINGGTSLLGKDIKAPLAWGLTTGENNAVMAIIDTGHRFTHPDLAAVSWTNPKRLLMVLTMMEMV